MNEARERLVRACESDDPQAALRVLGLAFGWAAQALENGLTNPAAAVPAVVGLHRALGASRSLIDVLPAVVAAAQPGPKVTELLELRTRALADAERELHRLVADLSALEKAEAELSARAAERDRLAGRIAELRRLESLGEDVDQLRALHTELEDRIGAVAAVAAAEESAAGRAAHRWAEALDNARVAVAGQHRDAIERAERLAAELAMAVRERDKLTGEADRLVAENAALAEAVRDARRRHNELTAEWDSLREQAWLRAEADRAIAEALSGVAGDETGHPPDLATANRALAAMEQGLAGMESALATVLRQQEADRAREHGRSHLDDGAQVPGGGEEQ